MGDIIAKAAEWFRGEAAKISDAIGSGTIESQVKNAYQLREHLVNGATAALYDPGKVALFESAFKLAPLEKVYAAVRAETPSLSEEALHRAVLKQITYIPPEYFSFEVSVCFAKGTLVHTKDGLTPIEKLKIGDWVLSKPENGGPLDYKRVTQVFEHEPAEVVKLFYKHPDQLKLQQQKYSELTTTLNHPFWSVGQGWVEAGELQKWPGEESHLLLADGREMLVTGRQFIFQTTTPNIGWLSSVGNLTDEEGWEWDFEKQCMHRDHVFAEEYVQELGELLQIPVFNIEVEDFHTYFVGEDGVWVHNKNTNTAIAVMNGGPALPEGTPVFQSDIEVTKYIRDNPNGQTWGVKPSKIDANAFYFEAQNRRVPDNVTYEGGVKGRLVGPDGVVWEYVVIFENEGGGKSFILVEGRYLNRDGIDVFIDRKWNNFIKVDNYDEALSLLWRVTQRLEQSNAPVVSIDTTRWTYEMNTGVRVPDLAGLRKARDFLNAVRANDGRYSLKVLNPITNKKDIIDPDNAAKMARIRAVLGPNEAALRPPVRRCWNSAGLKLLTGFDGRVVHRSGQVVM